MSRIAPFLRSTVLRGSQTATFARVARPAVTLTVQLSTTSIVSAKKSGPSTSSSSKSSAKGKGKSKASQDVLAEEKLSEKEIEDVLRKAETKMEKAMDWFRGILYEGVERGRGRVTPGASYMLSKEWLYSFQTSPVRLCKGLDTRRRLGQSSICCIGHREGLYALRRSVRQRRQYNASVYVLAHSAIAIVPESRRLGHQQGEPPGFESSKD